MNVAILCAKPNGLHEVVFDGSKAEKLEPEVIRLRKFHPDNRAFKLFMESSDLAVQFPNFSFCTLHASYIEAKRWGLDSYQNVTECYRMQHFSEG